MLDTKFQVEIKQDRFTGDWYLIVDGEEVLRCQDWEMANNFYNSFMGSGVGEEVAHA